MSDDANPPFGMCRVEVFSGLERLFRHDFPMARMAQRDIAPLLRALVLRHEPLSPQEFIDGTLNKRRRGAPIGFHVSVGPQQVIVEHERISFTASGPTISAMIYWRMTETARENLRHLGKL